MPAEDPNEMQTNQGEGEGLLSGEKAILDDLGGSTEPTDEEEGTLEQKVDEARDRLSS
ncbi:MAG TPA: hypothetical protein VM324_10630 [Egibacteraceae bacterium]|jgi:hypothetical protein|nr:hypothetical protein [Egibacteraceae bacterium]